MGACLLFLPILATSVAAFSAPLQHKFDPPPPKVGAQIDSNNAATPSNLRVTRYASRFVEALLRGMTLPFPTLAKLLHKTDTLPAKATSTPSAGFSLKESLLAIGAYLSLGVLVYSSVLHRSAWSIVDALYFSVVTFTSVGYGDLCPETSTAKVFTILFGLIGIALLGFAIGTIGSRFMELEKEMVQATQEASRQRLLHGLQNNQATTSSDTTSSTALSPAWRQLLKSFLTKTMPALVVLLLGGVLMGRLEGWSLMDSIYYSFITATTVGYGDYSCATKKGRLWGIVYIPLAVAVAGEVLGGVASALVERRQKRYAEALLDKELDLQQLIDMDADHNGRVSKEEYLSFMLLQLDLVSPSQLDEIRENFDKLDVDGGGYLNKQDLKTKYHHRVREQRHQGKSIDSGEETTDSRKNELHD